MIAMQLTNTGNPPVNGAFTWKPTIIPQEPLTWRFLEQDTDGHNLTIELLRELLTDPSPVDLDLIEFMLDALRVNHYSITYPSDTYIGCVDGRQFNGVYTQ